ncbi:MAG: hypothetical protein EOO38_08605 [Cytophagaceae bacterium]|nr:MAG: hypothetical protein EOO38_08605 [Cytophagaceae bacterium]
MGKRFFIARVAAHSIHRSGLRPDTDLEWSRMEIKRMTRDEATRALKQQGTRTYIVRQNKDGEIVVSTKDFNGRIAHTVFEKQQDSDRFVATPRFMKPLPDMLKGVPAEAPSLEALMGALDQRLGPSLYAPRGQTFDFNAVVPSGAPRPAPPKPSPHKDAGGIRELEVMRMRAAKRKPVFDANSEAAEPSHTPSNHVSTRANRARHYGAASMLPIAADAPHSTGFTNIYGNASRIPDYRAVLHDVELTSGSMMINLMNMARLQPASIKERLVENADGTVTVAGLYHPFTGEPLPDQRVDLNDEASKRILWSQHVPVQNPKNAGNQTWAAVIYVAAAKNFAAAVAEHGTPEEKANEKITLANVANQKVIGLMLHGRTAAEVPLSTQSERAAAENYIQTKLNANVPMSVSLNAHSDYRGIRNLAVMRMVKNLPGRVFLDLCAAYDCGKISFRMPLDEFAKYGAVLSHV